MLNTAANDAPYVTGAIFDPATADFDHLNAAHIGGFDGDTINPVVVNADGSFVAAFAVNAPSYFWNINPVVGSNGIAFLAVAGGVLSEIVLPSLVQGQFGPIAYFLTGRDTSNNLVSIPVTPSNGRIVVTEAIAASFAPGTSPALFLNGLQPGSNAPMFATMDVRNFYDTAAPTTTVQITPTTPIVNQTGAVFFNYSGNIIEAFTLVNPAAWTTGSTVFNLVIASLEPLDLSGVTQPVAQANVFAGTAYRTVITVTADGGVVSVPQTVLQQLQSQPGLVTLQVNNAVVGSSPQVSASVELPATTITEGLYTQHFDAAGNPTGDAVRVDEAANALIPDEDDAHYTMSRSADGGLVIAWLGNADEDGEADAVYVAKLDDAGNRVGETIALTGLADDALDSLTNEGGAADIAALADGGFAVAYTVEADTIGGYSSAFGGGPNGSASVTFSPIRGQLESLNFDVSNPIAANLASQPRSGFVSGLAADGSTLQVSVTIVGGMFEMTDAIRDQFAAGARLALTVSGVTNPAAAPGSFGFYFVPAFSTARDIYEYDEGSALVTTTRTMAVSSIVNPINSSDAFPSGGYNPTTEFHINDITAAAGETPQYVLFISAGQPIDAAGLNLYTGVVVQPFYNTAANTVNAANGRFTTTIQVTPVNGVVAVPQAVLDQFPNGGFISALVIRGLAAGSSVSVDVTERQPAHIIQPGAYTQTFGADGAADAPPQRIDDADASLADAATLSDENATLDITADADGGFRVSWIAQASDGSDFDRIISREFDADGNAVGTALDISAADIPGVVEANATGGEIAVPDHMQMVELGGGGFATLVQIDANNAHASVSAFTLAPGNGNTGSVTFTPLQGQLASVQIDMGNPVGAALASQPRAGFVSGKGLDGNPLQVAVVVVNGQFDMTADIRAQFAPNEELSLTVTGVTNPAAPNGLSFVFVPAYITSRDIFTYDASSPTLTINSAFNAFNAANPTTPDSTAGTNIGRTIAFQINALTASATETPDFVLYVSSEQPINTAGLSVYAGVNAPPLYSNIPNNTLSPLGLFTTTISVTPVAGRIDVPQALLDQFPHGGVNISLNIRGLQGGTQVNVDTIVQQPSQVLNTGLFVQLFDSAGVPTGDFIRVDDAATAIVQGDDYSQSSIQSDGAGGFRVVWASDSDGDGDSDALNIRHYDADGQQIGGTTSIDSIPDRIFDEGEPVTLYTSGIFADPDPGEVLTFSASGLPNGLSIDPVTGVIGGSASQTGLFAVTVTATDAGGLSASSSFEIFILNAGDDSDNFAPTAVSFTNAVAITPENGAQIKVADIVVADDGIGTNTLALSGADAAAFSIIGSELFFNGGGDFEGLAAYDVTVSASDPALADAAVSADFHLALSDVAEAKSYTGTKFDDVFIVDDLTLDHWTVDGGKGNDAIITGAGEDIVRGGSGDDGISGGGAGDTLFGGIGADIIGGGDGDDNIMGEVGNDLLQGGTGADSIDGGDDDDTILGEAGADNLLGGSGNDNIDGGADNDTIDGGAGNDTIVGMDGSDNVVGNSGDDRINGNGGSDTLAGGIGADIVLGDGGADIVTGDAGDDFLRGGSGADRVDGGTGNDDIGGDLGFDNLFGGIGNDAINGGGNNDIIDGGAGTDQLTGGLGADTFVFTLKTDSRLGLLADHITDFSSLEDRLNLSAMDANTKLADDQAFTWIGSANFSKVAGQLRYEVIGGSAHITGDLNGDNKADFEILLDGVTSLPGTSDFLIL